MPGLTRQEQASNANKTLILPAFVIRGSSAINKRYNIAMQHLESIAAAIFARRGVNFITAQRAGGWSNATWRAGWCCACRCSRAAKISCAKPAWPSCSPRGWLPAHRGMRRNRWLLEDWLAHPEGEGPLETWLPYRTLLSLADGNGVYLKTILLRGNLPDDDQRS